MSPYRFLRCNLVSRSCDSPICAQSALCTADLDHAHDCGPGQEATVDILARNHGVNVAI